MKLQFECRGQCLLHHQFSLVHFCGINETLHVIKTIFSLTLVSLKSKSRTEGSKYEKSIHILQMKYLHLWKINLNLVSLKRVEQFPQF